MRFVAIVGITAVGILATGCASIGFNAGVPVLTKGGAGLIVSETDGLPDMERGRQARLVGKPEQAIKDLLPLAEQGYPDAMTLLAATYQDIGTVPGVDEAEKWYRRALSSRPDTGLSLARLLISRSDRQQLPFINTLIKDAEKRGNEEVDSVKLQRYLQFPDLDTDGEGDRIALRSLKSTSPGVQVQALGWYRENIAKGENAAILEQNCRLLVQVEPGCYIDLAHFYRYRSEREKLEKLIADALKTFQVGASSAQPADSARLYRPPTQYAYLTGRLAAAMVDQINDDTDEPETESAAVVSDDLNFEDDDLDGDVTPSSSLTDIKTDSASKPVDAAGAEKSTAESTQVIELADKILRWMLLQGGDFPLEAATVAVRYTFLLPDVDVESILRKSAQAGSPTAISALADLLFNGQRGTRRPLEAIELYQKCLLYTSTKTRANSRLGRIYQMGIVGAPDPMLSMRHYLEAARAGSVIGYTSLARMFTGAPGIQVNRINTYVFGRRAEDGGRPLIRQVRKLKQINELRPNIQPVDMFEMVPIRLLNEVASEMTPEEMERALKLYEMEKAFQPMLKQPIPADIYLRGRSQ